MEMFATAGGHGGDVIPLCGCWFGVLLVAVLGVLSIALRSYWVAGTALLLAISQAALAISAVVNFVPSDDPDEDHQEALVWQVMFWAAVQVVTALAALVVVNVRRRKRPLPGPPSPFDLPTYPPPAGT